MLRTRSTPLIALGVALSGLIAGCEGSSEDQQGAGTAGSASSGDINADLVVELKMDRATYAAGDPQVLTFTVTNTTDENQQVFNWATPLFGIGSNMFRVTSNGVSAKYMGILATRLPPQADAFSPLAPGKSLTVTFTLSDTYDIHQAGQYSVEYVGKLNRQFAPSGGSEAPRPKLFSNMATFTLQEARPSKLDPTLSSIRPKIMTTLRNPNYADCTPNQRDTLYQDLQEARRLASEASAVMRSTPSGRRERADRYTHWFGSYAAHRYDEVQNNFSVISDALIGRVGTFECESSCKNDGRVAYVYYGSGDTYKTIHICPGFWGLTPSGTDSRGGVVLHEISHFSDITDLNDRENGDEVYGQNDCVNLAAIDPPSAIRVADCHAFFAENPENREMVPRKDDFNFDHQTDLVWHNDTTGQTYFWYMNDTTRISDPNPMEPSLNTPSPWIIVATNDWDGDGKPDFLWHNQDTGQVSIWQVGWIYTPTILSAPILLPTRLNTQPSTGWHIVGWNDFNLDGKLDILWHNDNTGVTHIWYMDLTDRFDPPGVLAPELNVADNTGWHIVGTNDFNRDGKADILWHNRNTSQVHIWYMDNTTRLDMKEVSFSAAGVAGWDLVGSNDYNADGHADLLWRKITTGETSYWYMKYWTWVNVPIADPTRPIGTFDPSLNVPSVSGYKLVSKH